MKKLLKNIGKLIAGGSVAFTFIDLVGHPAVVTGNSMFPTLHGDDARWYKRDFVWLCPWSKPERGDIWTFTSPRDPKQLHIKRLTAFEGDLVRPKNKLEMMIVPKGNCWMESDNEHNLFDSNVYGPVAGGLLKFRATHVIWPPSRWKSLRDY